MRHVLPILFRVWPCAFLLACPAGDDGSDTDAADSGTAAVTTTASGTDTEQSSGSDTTAGSGGATSTGPSTAPGDGSSTGAGIDPVGTCMTTCEHLMGCNVVMVPNCGIPCANIAADVAGCESEYVAQQECVGGLSCEDAQLWSDALMMGGGYPCGSEDMAFQACLP